MRGYADAELGGSAAACPGVGFAPVKGDAEERAACAAGDAGILAVWIDRVHAAGGGSTTRASSR